jgi:hypothetical protein
MRYAQILETEKNKVTVYSSIKEGLDAAKQNDTECMSFENMNSLVTCARKGCV